MRKVTILVLLRLVLLVAVGAAAALFIEYQHAGDPAFCGVGSGCLAVRLSPYSKLFGAPLPTLGLVAYAGLFLLYLIARTREHLRFGALVAGLGGVAAVVLIVLQATKINAFCKWCMIVDGSAILAAVLAGALALLPGDESDLAALVRHRGIAAAWVLAGALAVAAPFFWGNYPVIPPLSPQIAALEVPGKITIVSFTDFECPFCRKLHPTLHEIIDKHPDRFVLVRKMMPLSGHPGAMPAALAYMCTPESARPRMVDSLYSVPEVRFTREGTLGIAAGLGLDRDAFARCVDAPETRAAVEKDIQLFTDIEGQALPLTYVGPRVILGFNPERIERASELALSGEQPSLPVSSLLVLLGVAFAAAAAVTFRFAPRRC